VFDQRHLGGRLAERGAPLRAGDVIDAGRDLGLRAQVGAHEHDPGARRGRVEAEVHRGTGQKADALDLRRPGERALVAVTGSPHERRLPWLRPAESRIERGGSRIAKIGLSIFDPPSSILNLLPC
jgi:hypothetical protein